MLWSQRRSSGAHGAENSIQISALAGVEPRTWHLAAADVATRLPRTPPFSRLLRHAGDYSRTILTPNLQVTLRYIKICPGPKADWPCLHLGNARCGMKICRAW